MPQTILTTSNENSYIGFTCEICGEAQTTQFTNYYPSNVFPVCDQCKSDLKEFVLEKREAKMSFKEKFDKEIDRRNWHYITYDDDFDFFLKFADRNADMELEAVETCVPRSAGIDYLYEYSLEVLKGMP